MFSVIVEHEFCAAHAIRIRGELEPVHGHNFRVTAELEGERLDGDGLLCDFHAVHARLVEICGPFENGSLNGTPPFDRVNPTAEHLAEHIGNSLAETYPVAGQVDGAVRVSGVRVTEAPGCVAVYRPGGGS